MTALAVAAVPTLQTFATIAEHRRGLPRLLRKTGAGAASIVYFLATVDATFIRKYARIVAASVVRRRRGDGVEPRTPSTHEPPRPRA